MANDVLRATIRDLFRFSLSFRFGSIILTIVGILLLLSFFSPFESDDRRVVPRNKPPSQEFIMGTTGTGQDGFWLLTFAIRNTLMVSGVAVLIGRSIAVMVGMITGYLGGKTDRVISSIVDSIIVIPRLPLLILIAAILQGEMTVLSLALLLGVLDWAHPSKRYRAMILSLREREFTHTAIFSGMNAVKVVVQEHLPFLIPLLLADAVAGFLWAIGMEVTLSVLGLSDLSAPSIGTLIFWGNYHHALLRRRVWILAAPIAASVLMVVGFYLVSLSLSEYLDPRTRLSRLTVEE
ncbi:MAG: ABC transporter permease [Chloroflexota bacterium]|nr:ABC transporter permease [Chloroflexota bacterium]